MKRLEHISFAATPTPRPSAPQTRAGQGSNPLPRDAMWRSRRVESGSDWMDAWVRKPARRG